MKRVLLMLTMALLIPGVLSAEPTVGLYFDVGVMGYNPSGPYTAFEVYLYIHDAAYYVTGFEYQLLTPDDPDRDYFGITEIIYPEYVSVDLGHPFSGHAITFWPPLGGYTPGYNLMCTFMCYTTVECGQIQDYRLVIAPHPDSGELRSTYAPDNEYFYPIGLTSVLCPSQIATEAESWGAIKSLYK